MGGIDAAETGEPERSVTRRDAIDLDTGQEWQAPSSSLCLGSWQIDQFLTAGGFDKAWSPGHTEMMLFQHSSGFLESEGTQAEHGHTQTEQGSVTRTVKARQPRRAACDPGRRH